jgi:hypothetical protein
MHGNPLFGPCAATTPWGLPPPLLAPIVKDRLCPGRVLSTWIDTIAEPITGPGDRGGVDLPQPVLAGLALLAMCAVVVPLAGAAAG